MGHLRTDISIPVAVVFEVLHKQDLSSVTASKMMRPVTPGIGAQFMRHRNAQEGPGKDQSRRGDTVSGQRASLPIA